MSLIRFDKIVTLLKTNFNNTKKIIVLLEIFDFFDIFTNNVKNVI